MSGADITTIDRQINEHLDAIAKLREVGIRIHGDLGTPGHDCVKWLTGRGMTDTAARALCVRVMKERRAGAGREWLAEHGGKP